MAEGQVLPALREAGTIVRQIEESLKHIDALTGSIAAKSRGFSGGAGGGMGGGMGGGQGDPYHPTLANVMPHMPTPNGRRSLGGFSGTIIDGEAVGNRPATTSNGMPVPTFGGGSVVLGSAGSPIGAAGAVGGGSGNGLVRGPNTSRDVLHGAVTSFTGSAINQLLSPQPGVVADDLFYNSLRISAGRGGPGPLGAGMDFQRRTAPIGLNKAFSGGFTSHTDLMNAAGTLYGTGMNFQSMTGQFGSDLSTFARAGGVDLNSAAQMSANFAKPSNVALGRMYGINMSNPRTGAPADIMTITNQLYGAIYHGQRPTTAQVDAGFGPGGSATLSLQALGVTDPGQVMAVRRAFEARASTGQPLTAASMKAAGLTDNLNATTRDRTASADLNKANQFHGMASGIEDANAAAKNLSDSMHGLTSAFGDFTGEVRGFMGAIGHNPGSGGSNMFGGSIGSMVHDVTNDLILSRMLGRGGAGGLMRGGGAIGALARAPGLRGIASALGSRGMLGLGDLGVMGAGLAGGAGLLGGMGGEWLGKKVGHPHLGGVAGGAAAGAGIGALFGGVGAVPGAFIGGAVGGIASFFGGPDDKANHGWTSLDPGTDLHGPKNGSTIAQILQMARGMPVPYRVTSGFREGGSSLHALGEAVDFATPTPSVDSPGLLSINQYFANRYGSALAELIHAGPGGINIKNGQRVDGVGYYGAQTMSEHHNHVHVGITPDGLKKLKLGAGGDPTVPHSNSMNTSGGGLGSAHAMSTSNPFASASASAMTARGRAMLITDQNAQANVNLMHSAAAAVGAAVLGGGMASTPGSTAPQHSGGMPPGDAMSNARTIYNVGRRMGVSPRGIEIAIATALDESGLINLHSGDRDSQGLFQQRPSQGWGTVGQVTNPAHAAESFYARLKGEDYQHMSLAMAAQNVQRSGTPDGSNYAKFEGQAAQIYNQLASSSPKHASGVYDVTRDHLATIHSGEMVLPDRIAKAVRASMSGASIGGSGCHVSITVVPTKVDHSEAQRLATMVMSLLKHENHLAAVGTF